MKTIQEQAQEAKANGSPLSIEKLIAILEKKEARQGKKEKRSAKAWDKRAKQKIVSKTLENTLSTMTEGERNEYFEKVALRSKIGQLPSSMR